MLLSGLLVTARHSYFSNSVEPINDLRFAKFTFFNNLDVDFELVFGKQVQPDMVSLIVFDLEARAESG